MVTPMTTLCYIEKEDSYLMLHRVSKEKDINKDKWVGIGGHFEEGESPEECLLREVYEETGLRLASYKFRGLITFVSDEWGTEYMCLFTSDEFEGSVQDEDGNMRECDEGRLCWVPKDKVYSLNIWEGDKVFFRLLEERQDFFTLKLRYEGDKLVENVVG